MIRQVTFGFLISMMSSCYVSQNINFCEREMNRKSKVNLVPPDIRI